MVDPGRVRRKLELLSGYLEQLELLRDLPVDEYEHEQAFAGRYLVQASAQACIDIANHVIASSGWRTAKDFGDAFTVLEEHAVLEPGLAERMRKLAGLRNLLVHVYEEIDDRSVHASLAEGLDDLSRYAQGIARLLEQAADEP